MILIIIICILPLISLSFLCFGLFEEKRSGIIIGLAGILICFIILAYGIFHGFIYHPRTEGTHQGIITAVDLEGVYFRRYEIYLKSSGYTNQSDETKYLIYDYEIDLAQRLKDAIGKKVKLHYGHDGGYIPWNSCGTYHVKNVEIVED